MPYKRFAIDSRVTLIQETGVANFMRCNIWHVKGRDYDLVIDTGMGLDPLKSWIQSATGKPLKAVVTHCHFDHAGCLHEFDTRLGHRAEASILASPTNKSVVYDGVWTRIAIVDPVQHPDYTPESFQIKAAPLTGYLDEGDVLDLGDCDYQILHLPGHSPGSIGLWDRANRVLFSGDAIYDGELLDNLYHSDAETYLKTLERIEFLNASVFHAGHFPSFGYSKMKSLIQNYRNGQNRLIDVQAWFEAQQKLAVDNFADQDWSGFSDVSGQANSASEIKRAPNNAKK